MDKKRRAQELARIRTKKHRIREDLTSSESSESINKVANSFALENKLNLKLKKKMNKLRLKKKNRKKLLLKTSSSFLLNTLTKFKKNVNSMHVSSVSIFFLFYHSSLKSRNLLIFIKIDMVQKSRIKVFLFMYNSRTPIRQS